MIAKIGGNYGSNYRFNAASIVLGAACIAAPLLVGMLSASLAGDQMMSFGELEQPPLSPPAWLFPVVWTILYILMGTVLLIILRSEHRYKTGAVVMFVSQMAMNFLWSPVFFVERDYTKALVILVFMLIFTGILTFMAWRIKRIAAIMLMPYIVWMLFASYLTIGVGTLNQ